VITLIDATYSNSSGFNGCGDTTVLISQRYCGGTNGRLQTGLRAKAIGRGQHKFNERY
jgi:hypothetical protein